MIKGGKSEFARNGAKLNLAATVDPKLYIAVKNLAETRQTSRSQVIQDLLILGLKATSFQVVEANANA